MAQSVEAAAEDAREIQARDVPSTVQTAETSACLLPVFRNRACR